MPSFLSTGNNLLDYQPPSLKSLLKAICGFLAIGLILPAFIAYQAAAWVLGKQVAFAGWSQCLSLLPGLTGVYLRWAFYRLALPRCGVGCCISFGTIFSHATAEVGSYAYVGNFCCLGDVTIEDDVLLGSHVSVTNGSGQHGIDRLDIPIREQPGVWPRVTVGRDSWIGDRAAIMADVGKHCVIGAGSVVTKPVPDYAIAVGVPAKVVRYRNQPGACPIVNGPEQNAEAQEERPSLVGRSPNSDGAY
jgi:acetyltransferase-like isoleucine patch superfamily enzyme